MQHMTCATFSPTAPRATPPRPRAHRPVAGDAAADPDTEAWARLVLRPGPLEYS